jgi:hypothetical protein
LHEKNGRSWWNGLYGMTDLSMPDLVVVARSWNSAPELEVKSEGFESGGYDLGRRCYVVHRKENADGDILAVRIMASEESPVYNPSLVVRNWDRESLALRIDGKTIPRGKDFRAGVHRTLEGSNVIVWLKARSTEPVSVTLE